MELRLTKHAQVRCQQRGITDKEVEIVYRFGKCRRTRDGFTYSMNHRGRARASHILGKAYRSSAGKLNIYLVVDRGRQSIITVGHRLRRHRAN